MAVVARVRESATNLGHFFDLLADWASATRMGRLRGAGLLGALAAVFTWWADLHVLSGRGSAGWALAGSLSLPAVAAGYWHVGEALRGAVPRAAALVRIAGYYSVGVGSALHALLAATTSGGTGASDLVLSLWLATSAGLAVASLVFCWAIATKASDYPPALAWLSPAPVAIAVCLLSWLVPPWRTSGFFVAPHVAHLVFFTASVIVIEWYNPDRWE